MEFKEIMKKSIFLLTIAIIFSLIIQISVSAKEIRFVQVTDTHYSSDNDFSKRVLEATINDINNLNDVSFVVFTGDNIDKPNPEYLRDFIRKANKLKKPYYIILGNHDVYRSSGMSKQQYMEIVKNNNLLYPTMKPNYAFKKEDFAFIIVDGAKEIIPNSNGYYRKDTLDWMEKKIERYNKYPVIILQHFPLIPPKDIKSHTTFQADEYLERLKKYNNVIAIVAGHYHYNGEIMQDGIYHISTPTLLKEPYQYKIIDISVTKGFSPMIYTQLKSVEVD